MEKILYLYHPDSILKQYLQNAESFFAINLVLSNVNELEKKEFLLPSVHQKTYRRIIEGLKNFIPINIIRNNFDEKI